MKNRNKVFYTIVSVFLVCAVLVGCGNMGKKVGKKVGEKVNEKVNEQIQVVKENISEELKKKAKEEGIPVEELESIVDELSALGAEKYGISKEEYIKQIEDDGGTVLGKWEQTADMMGVSIKELYAYEKDNVENMSDEDKATLAGMAEALEEAQNILLPEQGNEGADVGDSTGIYTNTSGEIRTVTMSDDEIKEALLYKQYKILQDYKDDYSIVYEYVTKAEFDDLVAYYDDLIINTEDYMKMAPKGVSNVMMQGRINEIMIYIEIDKSDPGMARVSNYIDFTSKK